MTTKSRRKTTPQLDDYVPRRGRPPANKDEVTSMLLATGEATMAQIAQLFNTDAKTLPKRMRGIVPKGTRRGYKVYDIAEAAGMIVRPGYEIEDFIRQMSPQELPPLLSKEFWNGQNARINYEKNMGHLWSTEDVVAAFGEILNIVRMTVLLVADDVEREAGLTEAQRLIIRRIMDAMISTMRANIEEKFKEYHANRIANPLAPVTGSLDDDDFNVSATAPVREDADEAGDEEPEDGEAVDEDSEYPDPDEGEGDDGNILASEDDEEEDDGI
jgi:hypothetical protein